MDSFEDAARALEEAAATRDRLAAWDAAGRVVAHLTSATVALDASRVFSLVWKGAAKNRWFDIAELIAATAAARPEATPAVARLHAQMLMERGLSEEALARLHDLMQARALSPQDQVEAFGHVGRIYKDRFLAAAHAKDETAARAFLAQSLRQGYGAGYDSTGSPWLGINAAALLSRPEAESVERGAAQRAQQIARDIRAQVSAQVQRAATQPSADVDPRDRQYAEATLAEACLTFADYDAALGHVKAYVADPLVNAFGLSTFRRQLAEVWRLGTRPHPCPEILAFVTAAALDTEGGVVHVSGREVERARNARSVDYQAVFGTDRFDSYENYRRGLERCTCVARIGRTADTGLGTGFVVPGRVLCDTLGPSFVLVTNAHVVSEADAERAAGAVHPQEAIVTFAALDGVAPSAEFTIARVFFSSPREDLDVVVAELSPGVGPSVPYAVAGVLPLADSRAPVRVIGHPSGRGLSLSTNALLDHQAPRLHYSTATEGGSSGSPVFNHEWKLIGIHHAGGEAVPRLNGKAGTYAANEGIWIASVCEAVRRTLS